ncbi:hypothetical protein GEMRC1_011058 [Eukaryota sp. GEM-RC1]
MSASQALKQRTEKNSNIDEIVKISQHPLFLEGQKMNFNENLKMQCKLFASQALKQRSEKNSNIDEIVKISQHPLFLEGLSVACNSINVDSCLEFGNKSLRNYTLGKTRCNQTDDRQSLNQNHLFNEGQRLSYSSVFNGFSIKLANSKISKNFKIDAATSTSMSSPAEIIRKVGVESSSLLMANMSLDIFKLSKQLNSNIQQDSNLSYLSQSGPEVSAEKSLEVNAVRSGDVALSRYVSSKVKKGNNSTNILNILKLRNEGSVYCQNLLQQRLMTVNATNGYLDFKNLNMDCVKPSLSVSSLEHAGLSYLLRTSVQRLAVKNGENQLLKFQLSQTQSLQEDSFDDVFSPNIALQNSVDEPKITQVELDQAENVPTIDVSCIEEELLQERNLRQKLLQQYQEKCSLLEQNSNQISKLSTKVKLLQNEKSGQRFVFDEVSKSVNEKMNELKVLRLNKILYF